MLNFRIDNQFFIDRITDDKEGLRIYLSDGDGVSTLVITFDSAIAYRNTDEGDLLRADVRNMNDGQFFEASESEYLAWFHWQSQGIHEDGEHYSLCNLYAG